MRGYLTMLSPARGQPAEPASSTDGQSYQDDGCLGHLDSYGLLFICESTEALHRE